METEQFIMKVYPEVNGDWEKLNDIIQAVSRQSLDKLWMCKANSETESKIKDHKTQRRLSNLTLNEELPFSSFFQLLVSKKFDAFYKRIELYSLIKDPVYFSEKIFTQVVDKLWERSYKTLIHLLRHSDLKGDNETERFHYFNQVLLNDKDFIDDFFRQYETIESDLETEMERSLSYIEQVISHCEENKDTIKKRFSVKSLTLQEISMGQGDTHQNGKAVCLLYFDELTLAYKPRNLAIDASYQQLLKKLNYELNLNLETIQVLSFENYGFIEFVPHSPCVNEKEVAEFYQKIGAHLTILYILNASDMHFENVIAKGSNPVLIDLETLFTPQLLNKHDYLDDSLKELYKRLETSVHSIALLSTEVGQQISMDIGGISKNKRQKSPYKMSSIQNMYSDKMKYLLENVPVEEKQNNPKLDGITVDSTHYKSVIWDSFTRLYCYFMNHKASVKQMIYSLFQKKNVRYLHRSTMFYSKLIGMQTYPIFMKDERFKRLLFHRVGVNYTEQDKPFLGSEYTDLNRYDVPFFQANTSDTYIMNSSQRKLGELLSIEPLYTVLNKISDLSEEDLAEQKRIFDITFMNNQRSSADRSAIEFKNKDNHTVSSKDNYFKTAVEIGDHLVKKMISVDEHGYWLGPTINLNQDDDTWMPGMVGMDVYNGNSGMCIFLSHLYAVTENEKYKKAAIKALQPIVEYLDKIDEIDTNLMSVGALSGLSSYIYALSKCGKHLNDKRLMNYAKNGLHWIVKKIEEENIKDSDYIYGLTGIIYMISNMYETFSVNSKSNLTKLMHVLGEQLSKNPLNEVELSGFAHGLSSIMGSYALLYYYTGVERYKQLAYECMDVLEDYYSDEDVSWYNSLTKKDISYGFCHGSPGIVLGYLTCDQAGLKVPITRLRNVVNQIKKTCFGSSITYCHGDIGNLEILQEFAKHFKDEELEKEVGITAKHLYETNIKSIFSYNLGNAYVFGTMLGLSGIGLFLLNQYSPETVRTNLLLCG